ncbi:MAG TPA: CDP-alcohol phosphatidyltransferase family protein [Allosphingosinicella sp.]|jgi:CDP-L-myo-inositol myo-inositolphosphotransferase|nr:CDP-alcohol phosphatidyltransferase family protein [Allosphingosinicella sp.]
MRPSSLERRTVAFASARDADRRVAGVAAAARVVHALAAAGVAEAWLTLGPDAALAPSTMTDIERLRGGMRVMAVRAGGAPAGLAATPAPILSAMAILRATTKPGDGIVSRHLNRPISQRISLCLLLIRGTRPIHATIASAVFAIILFWGMLAGGRLGLILGGVLFQAASIIDGVDGEVARATFRATDFGKTLDSAIDMATNLIFLLGLTLHLGRHGGALIFWTGMWAVGVVTLGAGLIAWRVRSDGGPLSFDLLKPRGRRPPGLAQAVIRFFTPITSRDFFAFLFMILIVAGLAWTALCIFATVATGWIAFVLASLLSGSREGDKESEMGCRDAA